jgi:uncharacterized delta-60 repeat protein
MVARSVVAAAVLLSFTLCAAPWLRWAATFSDTLASASRDELGPGTLDPSFGSQGRVTTDMGGFDRASAVLSQPDGKLVVVGTSNVSGSETRFVALARYNADGSLDQTFGTGGKVLHTRRRGEPSEYASTAALQPDGKVVVAGSLGQPYAGDFLLMRFNPDGSLDAGFGTDGTVLTDFAGPDDVATFLSIREDGTIVAAGYSNRRSPPPTPISLAIAHYLPDGSLDPSFGTEGKVRTIVDAAVLYNGRIAMLPDGGLIVVGPDSPGPIPSGALKLARFRPDGGLDPTFGQGGYVISAPGDDQLPPELKFQRKAAALSLTEAGQLVVGATFGSGPKRGFSEPIKSSFGVARYNLDGSLDSAFGSNGVFISEAVSAFDEAYALVIQRDGKLVIGGTTKAGRFDERLFALVRYEPDGAPDRAFGVDGKVTTGGFNPGRGVARAIFYTEVPVGLAIQPDGNIVLVGGAESDVDDASASLEFALARYIAR